MKTFRCWYRDGSSRLVQQSDHRTAAAEAQELAQIANADMPKYVAERQRFLDACKVQRTECLTDGTEKRWK